MLDACFCPKDGHPNAGAGHTPKTIPKSRLLISFVLMVELWSLGALILNIMPTVTGKLLEELLLAAVCFTGITLQGR